MNIILSEAIIHTKIYFRERQAVFWGFVFPVFLLILSCSVFGGTPERATLLTAGLICTNVMSGALFSTGVITVGAREQGILRRCKVAPVAPWKIIGGLVISRFLSISLTTLILIVLARYFYHIRLPVNWLATIAVYTVGALMFCAIAFAVAGLAPTTAAANGIAQAMFLPMMFLSGATYPYEFMPGWMQRLSHVLPSAYYVAGLKRVMLSGGGITDNYFNFLVMCGFTIVAIAIAASYFRWE